VRTVSAQASKVLCDMCHLGSSYCLLPPVLSRPLFLDSNPLFKFSFSLIKITRRELTVSSLREVMDITWAPGPASFPAASVEWEWRSDIFWYREDQFGVQHVSTSLSIVILISRFQLHKNHSTVTGINLGHSEHTTF